MGTPLIGKDQTWENDLAARAAWMSFVGDLTQSEIARRLGVSSARVHRLIQLARQQGIVRITIEGRPAQTLHLETQIATKFNLKSCTISPYLGESNRSEELVKKSVGQAAGQLIAQHIAQPKTKRVTFGTSGDLLRASIAAMPEVARSDIEILPSQGCLSTDLRAMPSDIFSTLERRTGAMPFALPAPAWAATVEEHAVFMGLGSISDTLKKACETDLVVAEILPPIDPAASTKSAQAVASFLGTEFDASGNVLNTPLNQRSICLDLSELIAAVQNGHTRCMAIASETDTATRTLSALKLGCVTDLVLDEALAIDLAECVS